ncbi:uncharacterized protein EKO05_0006162 [Ascochyta rabiei]|uniref:uncharacterized protein n=1 Tax=Didymella rabiei TaxID=5454 RepID=UPI0021F9307B|nr:uncharacterized protein EKO05_0006162 [Ascochyta rabiei]UPX15722.1 hypothetical protein EKO05_0006162 [Ascochyta rabiei]
MHSQNTPADVKCMMRLDKKSSWTTHARRFRGPSTTFEWSCLLGQTRYMIASSRFSRSSRSSRIYYCPVTSTETDTVASGLQTNCKPTSPFLSVSPQCCKEQKSRCFPSTPTAHASLPSRLCPGICTGSRSRGRPHPADDRPLQLACKFWAIVRQVLEECLSGCSAAIFPAVLNTHVEAIERRIHIDKVLFIGRFA